MSKSYTYIKRKAEDAIEALLDLHTVSELEGVTIYKGFSASELTTPRIEIICASATPEIIGDMITGNWTVEAVINVVSHMQDVDRSTHASRCGYVEDVLIANDFCEEINSRSDIQDFTATLWTPSTSRDAVDGGEMITSYEGELYCSPSTLQI